MENKDNISGARMVNSPNIASGSVVVNNPFILAISGSNIVAVSNTSGALVIRADSAVIHWVELKKANS